MNEWMNEWNVLDLHIGVFASYCKYVFSALPSVIY